MVRENTRNAGGAQKGETFSLQYYDIALLRCCINIAQRVLRLTSLHAGFNCAVLFVTAALLSRANFRSYSSYVSEKISVKWHALFIFARCNSRAILTACSIFSGEWIDVTRYLEEVHSRNVFINRDIYMLLCIFYKLSISPPFFYSSESRTRAKQAARSTFGVGSNSETIYYAFSRDKLGNRRSASRNFCPFR